MRKYRDIDKIRETLLILKGAPVGNQGQIWQTRGPLREIFSITAIFDDENTRTIVFSTTMPFEFDKNFPVYVHVNNRNLIFKLSSRDYVLKENKLVCTYPKLTKAIEEREHQRIQIPRNKEFYILLRSMDISQAEIKVKLRDFSKKGVGITISESNREFIKNTKKFLIMGINEIKLPAFYEVNLTYIKKVHGGVHAGFKLRNEFSPLLLEEISKHLSKETIFS